MDSKKTRRQPPKCQTSGFKTVVQSHTNGWRQGGYVLFFYSVYVPHLLWDDRCVVSSHSCPSILLCPSLPPIVPQWSCLSLQISKLKNLRLCLSPSQHAVHHQDITSRSFLYCLAKSCQYTSNPNLTLVQHNFPLQCPPFSPAVQFLVLVIVIFYLLYFCCSLCSVVIQDYRVIDPLPKKHD